MDVGRPRKSNAKKMQKGNGRPIHFKRQLMKLFIMDFLLFAATASLAIWKVKSDKTCEAPLTNSAFVFVKPQANSKAVQDLVRRTLQSKGVTILSEADISGETIDEKKLIDQHYYAIASKATILPAKDIPVPVDKFKKAFGESWETVLAENRACNAMEACKRFGCDANQLDEAWGKAEKVEKFGGGFYCGLVSMNGLKLYVFNAFFMSMRSKFVGAGTSIHYFVVEFNPKTLSWAVFRNDVLGPTDPADGPPGSLRKAILDDFKALGLSAKPNKGDNGVHASASPFEGLAERMNWLGTKISDDPFGNALLKAGVSEKTIKDWSVDPRVKQPDGSMGSVFDALEDMDVEQCLEKLITLNKLNL